MQLLKSTKVLEVSSEVYFSKNSNEILLKGFLYVKLFSSNFLVIFGSVTSFARIERIAGTPGEVSCELDPEWESKTQEAVEVTLGYDHVNIRLAKNFSFLQADVINVETLKIIRTVKLNPKTIKLHRCDKLTAEFYKLIKLPGMKALQKVCDANPLRGDIIETEIGVYGIAYTNFPFQSLFVPFPKELKKVTKANLEDGGYCGYPYPGGI